MGLRAADAPLPRGADSHEPPPLFHVMIVDEDAGINENLKAELGEPPRAARSNPGSQARFGPAHGQFAWHVRVRAQVRVAVPYAR